MNEPTPNLEVIELQGRIQELVELNSALTQRCANTRGQLVLRDTEISRLHRELAHYKSRCEAAEETKAQPAPNGDGVKHAIQ